MNNEEKGGKINGLIKAANELRIKGENNKSLGLLEEAKGIAKKLRNKEEKRRAMGDVAHYKARTLQAMKRYREALIEIEKAIHLRKKDAIQRAYSVFQKYICKTYAGIKILPREVKETKKALLAAIAESKDTKQIGDFFQNLAYVESQDGNIIKAILLYKTTMLFREEADDERGMAMTWARLAECYQRTGDRETAKVYGERALHYFEKIEGDPERVAQVQNVLKKL